MTAQPTLRRSRTTAGVAAALTALTLTGCSGGSASPSATATSASGAAAGTQVLPVTSDPIKNTSTVQALKIDSVLVENNVDPATKAIAPDHLEIALSNTGTAPLTGFEVYYTITDTVTKASENYYTKLPASFAVAPGTPQVINFDSTGQPNHFPVNKFSLYYQSKNPLQVSVEVSAANAAVQKANAPKAAGGPEGNN